MKKFDIFEEVTKRIIAQLEEGKIPWEKPWKPCTKQNRGEITPFVAFNRVTKTVYSPLNQMLLSKTGEYATFKQWQDLGGKIRKGAKAEIVVFWKMQRFEEPNPENEEETLVTVIPLLKHYQVFHISDVEGVKPLDLSQITIKKDEDGFEPFEEAESIIEEYKKRENIRIFYGGDRAYYAPAQDIICLPNRSQFENRMAQYYSTAFHEITHSTGAKHRLDRLVPACFGCSEYAREELVAELGACGMLHQLGIETASSFQNTTAYIQSWLRALHNDKKLIVYASCRAEKAIRYILTGSTSDEDEE